MLSVKCGYCVLRVEHREVSPNLEARHTVVVVGLWQPSPLSSQRVIIHYCAELCNSLADVPNFLQGGSTVL